MQFGFNYWNRTISLNKINIRLIIIFLLSILQSLLFIYLIYFIAKSFFKNKITINLISIILIVFIRIALTIKLL